MHRTPLGWLWFFTVAFLLNVMVRPSMAAGFYTGNTGHNEPPCNVNMKLWNSYGGWDLVLPFAKERPCPSHLPGRYSTCEFSRKKLNASAGKHYFRHLDKKTKRYLNRYERVSICIFWMVTKSSWNTQELLVTDQVYHGLFSYLPVCF